MRCHDSEMSRTYAAKSKRCQGKAASRQNGDVGKGCQERGREREMQRKEMRLDKEMTPDRIAIRKEY